MASTVPEAERAAKAGADIIIAQGTEGGGHVGWMASMPLIPMVVDAVTHPNFKQAIVDSDGHDTQLSEIPDIAAGQVWPGAMTRSRRNRFIERWAGREWTLRRDRADAIEELAAARKSGDVDEGPLDGTGCRLDPRHPARQRARHPHRAGNRGDPDTEVTASGIHK
jgi:NAD(P)H-dependent flavin oxidoreductase YrpB (nitropropane dioxygenase family)